MIGSIASLFILGLNYNYSVQYILSHYIYLSKLCTCVWKLWHLGKEMKHTQPWHPLKSKVDKYSLPQCRLLKSFTDPLIWLWKCSLQDAPDVVKFMDIKTFTWMVNAWLLAQLHTIQPRSSSRTTFLFLLVTRYCNGKLGLCYNSRSDRQKGLHNYNDE